MGCGRRSLTSNFTQLLSRRLIEPSFSHLLHDDRDANPNPHPAPSPPPRPRNPKTHAQSFYGFGLFRPRDPRRSRVGFYTPLGVDPFLRSYSSAPEGSNEIDYIKDVVELLSDTTVDAAAAAAAALPAPYAGEVAAAAADSFFPVAALQYLIDGVHSVTGLNWWACIALTTILIRSATAPLLLNQLKATTKLNGIRGVWIKLPIKLANLVQPAVEEGFWYHHAEPTYLMLVYWIPDTKHTLPVNATHRVGVGAFVMNDKREVLAVQEKSGKFRGLGVWKFPTGVVDQGEDIFAGAIREVKEETDIDTEFLEVLAFRQSHMSFFEKSDLFFICMLCPLSFDIQKQESEIEAAQWIPIEEFAAQPFVQKHELLKYIIRVGVAKAENAYAGFVPVNVESAFTTRKSNLYLNIRDMKDPLNGSS